MWIVLKSLENRTYAYPSGCTCCWGDREAYQTIHVQLTHNDIVILLHIILCLQCVVHILSCLIAGRTW